MLRKLTLTAVAATPLSYLSTTIHADEGKAEPPRKVKVSQLSIYGEPEPPQLEFVPEKDNVFRQQVSGTRKTVWEAMDKTKDSIDSVKQKYETAKSHTNEMLHYIQEDSGMIPRAALITVAGLGGVVAGYRGGVMKKVVYCGIGMTAAGAVCYPHQAVDITKSGWDEISNQAVALWKQAKGTPDPPAKSMDIKLKTSEPETKDSKDETKPAAEGTPSKVDESKLDHGMSKPEDKDMYTTRSG